MGAFLNFTELFESFIGPKQKRILILGLDGAGKTTILYKLNLGDTVSTIPTIGFNLEKVRYKNIEFTCWDIGGQKKIRALWHHYFDGTHAIIFVVDANDKKRIGEAKQELADLMSHHCLKDATLLVYANKQDISGCIRPSDMAEMLGLTSSSFKNRTWFIQGCIGTTCNGLYEGLEWLSVNLRES